MSTGTEVAEQIARAFHEAYEDLAPSFSYRTREASAKPWADVPAGNKALMIATVGRLLQTGTVRPGIDDASDLRPREGQRGWHDVTCGNCGEEHGTNLAIADIQCPECEARRCPRCAGWFGGDNEPGDFDEDAQRAADLQETSRESSQCGEQLGTAWRLLDEALHLCQNGERAPGGHENWGDWGTKAERVLRGLPAASRPAPGLAAAMAENRMLRDSLAEAVMIARSEDRTPGGQRANQRNIGAIVKRCGLTL